MIVHICKKNGEIDESLKERESEIEVLYRDRKRTITWDFPSLGLPMTWERPISSFFMSVILRLLTQYRTNLVKALAELKYSRKIHAYWTTDGRIYLKTKR
jgi:hypothetical protein